MANYSRWEDIKKKRPELRGGLDFDYKKNK